MARGDLIDVGYGQMASPRTMCKSGFVWRYANTSQEAINTNSDIIEIFPYILRTATNYTPYSNDLRNSYVQITIGSTTTTQYLKSKYNFGNVSPVDKKFYLTSEYNSSNPFGYGTPDSQTYVTTRTIDSKTAYGARFTVPHNADGTAPTVSVKWHMTNSSSHSDIEKVESLILDTIPRTSKPTCGNVTLGGSVTINTNRASTSFTHTINIKVGGTTRQTFTNVGASQSWSPSYSTYLPIISGTSATATIECITYSGSTNIGTASTTCVITVPDNADTKPTASISIAKGDSVVPSSWGVYVKGKSKLAVTITGTAKAGTSIASYSSTANGSTYTTSTYTTAELTGSGSVTGFVKDARGFQSANATPVSYTVVDYANPQITTNTVARCTSNGTLSDEGTYVKYSFVGSISSVSNKNSKTFTLKYKEKSASSWTTIATWTSAYTLNQVDVVFGSGGIDITKEYVFRFEATDSFTTTAKEVEVGTVADIFNFNPNGKSLAIGGVSNRGSNEDVQDVYKVTEFHKDIKANVLDLFNDTSGSDWQAMMKNKIDYCISNISTSKNNAMAFINGGWSGQNYGFGIFSKIGTASYQLVWFSNIGYTYYVQKYNNNYTYKAGNNITVASANSASSATNATNNSSSENLITTYSRAGTNTASSFDDVGTSGKFRRSGLYTESIGGTWYNILNVRHRNGESDGTSYGLQIRNAMTTTTASSMSLQIRNQSNGSWGGWHTIQYAGVSLYDNSTGTSGTVTLSETSANFSYLDIYYKKVDSSNIASARIYAPNGKRVALSTIGQISTTSVQIERANISISGTSITKADYNYANIPNGSSQTVASANELNIVKVVGYRN